MILQIIASVFVVYALIKVWSRYRDRTLSWYEGVLWSLAWLAIAVIFWQPELASNLAVRLGIGRGADLIIYAAIICLVYIFFRLYVRVDRMDRTITKIVREITLHDEEKRRDNHS